MNPDLDIVKCHDCGQIDYKDDAMRDGHGRWYCQRCWKLNQEIAKSDARIDAEKDGG